MSKKVILVCRECLSRNYTVLVSPNRQEKLEIKKYCKHCGKHTEHVETR